MNAKVIFALSALLACACAEKVYKGTLWDESTGSKLKAGGTLTVTKVDDHFHAVFSNPKIITNEGATAGSVLPPHAWVLSEPEEQISFDFTFNPADGSNSVTFPPGLSASAQGWSTWLVEAIAQGKSIEHYAAKGEDVPPHEVNAVFGTCALKNINKALEGNDLTVTADVDIANCSKRHPLLTSPAESDSESYGFVIHEGKHLKKIFADVSVVKDGVHHKAGAQLIEA